MDRTPDNLLLTGPPRCGKTTVVRRVIAQLRDVRLAGFYTQEMRKHGQRVGFEAVGLSGQTATLAHVDFQGVNRVGRYVVDLSGFEAIVESELGRVADVVGVVVIDEIGRMECRSPLFVKLVTRVLDGPVPVLATVAAKGGGFIATVKARPDAEIIEVTHANRSDLPEELTRRLGAQ